MYIQGCQVSPPRQPQYAGRQQGYAEQDAWERQQQQQQQDLRSQLHLVQDMIRRKERECDENEARARHLVTELQLQLDFAESERVKLADALAFTRSQLTHLQSITPMEPVILSPTHGPHVVVHQPAVDPASAMRHSTQHLRFEFDKARAHEDSARQTQRQLDEQTAADASAREERLQKLLAEEERRSKDREESLKRQMDEERELLEERLRRTEELLKKQVHDERARGEARAAELEAALRDEKAAADARAADLRGARRELADLREQCEREKRALSEQLLNDIRSKEDEAHGQTYKLLDRERDAADRRIADLQKQLEVARNELRDHRSQLDEQERSLLLKTSAEINDLRDCLAEAKRAALDREAELRQQLNDSTRELERAGVAIQRQAADVAGALQKVDELQQKAAAAAEKLAREREHAALELAAERERLARAADLAAKSAREDLEATHRASIQALRDQLDNALQHRSAASPSPPPLRMPAEADADSVHDELLRAKAAADAQRARVKKLQRELDAAHGQLALWKANMETAEREVDEMRAREKARVQAEMTDANRRIAELKARRGSLEDAKSDSDRRVRDLSLQLEDAELRMKRQDAAAQQAWHDVNRQREAEAKRWASDREALEKGWRAAQEESDRLAALLDTLKTEQVSGIAALRREAERLKGDLGAARAQAARISEDLAARSVELAEVQSSLTAKTGELLNARSELSLCLRDKKSLAQTLETCQETLRHQTDRRHAENSLQGETVSLLETELSTMQGQLADLRAALKEKQASVDAITDSNNRLAEEISRLRAAGRTPPSSVPGASDLVNVKEDLYRLLREILRDPASFAAPVPEAVAAVRAARAELGRLRAAVKARLSRKPRRKPQHPAAAARRRPRAPAPPPPCVATASVLPQAPRQPLPIGPARGVPRQPLPTNSCVVGQDGPASSGVDHRKHFIPNRMSPPVAPHGSPVRSMPSPSILVDHRHRDVMPFRFVAMQPPPAGNPCVDQIDRMLDSVQAIIQAPPQTPAASVKENRDVSPLRDLYATAAQAQLTTSLHLLPPRDLSPTPTHHQPLIRATPSPVTVYPPMVSHRSVTPMYQPAALGSIKRDSTILPPRSSIEAELAELARKETELSARRVRTLATIDSQQASLVGNSTYWRDLALRYQGQGYATEAGKCRVKLAQVEEDLQSIALQRAEIVAKTDAGSSHLKAERARLTTLMMATDAAPHSVLHRAPAPVLAPPTSLLPPPLPAPVY
ncbi:hypothetical protein DIPPA_15134 [Diplonema papillatum]|nr:hypothetical protein DIPPA_15134 [Diplonema papillatum]